MPVTIYYGSFLQLSSPDIVVSYSVAGKQLISERDEIRTPGVTPLDVKASICVCVCVCVSVSE